MERAKAAGSRGLVAQRFDAFDTKLSDIVRKYEGRKGTHAIEKLCQDENKALRKQFKALTTIRCYYTSYRNICRQKLKNENLTKALEIFNLSPVESKGLKGLYEQKVAIEHRKLRPLKHFETMVEKAASLLKSPSLYDQILGLACLTGRRSAEIACTAQFKALEKDWMLFEGQLKGKTRVMDTYQIPVLGEPCDIIRALTHIRQQRPQWLDQPLLFHACGSKELSRRVKKHFYPFIDDPAVKDLRAAYAEICYHKFGAIDIAKSRFFSDILGHGESDNITGLSYIDFYIVKQETA